MPQPKHNRIEITVVVSGQPERFKVEKSDTLRQVVKEALRRSGNQGQAPKDWELRHEDGTLLDQSTTVQHAHIKDGMTLFLNPKAGAGGEI